MSLPILASTVLVPVIAAVISLILNKKVGGKTLTIVNTLSLLYSAIVLTLLYLMYGSYQDPVYFKDPVLGSFSMLLDPLSAAIAISIAIVTAAVSVYSLRYMSHRFEELGIEEEWGMYYFLYTLFSVSMIGTVLSVNLIEFYLFLELTLIPSFLLIAFYGYGDRHRISFMYLIWTHIGALTLLMGVLIAGYYSQSFDIAMVKEAAIPKWLRIPTLLLFTIGLLIKLASFGVHIWLPYAHAEAPTPVSALLSPNLIGIAGYFMARIYLSSFTGSFKYIAPALQLLAILTMMYGGFMALTQKDYKRLLAYSSISQMGYLLLGIAAFNPLSISGAILHYMTHALGKAILFMTAGMIMYVLHGLRDITKMGGLGAKMPITMAAALLGFMHITGIPPTMGIWSEIYIVAGAVKSFLNEAVLIQGALSLIFAIGLTTAYSFVTIKRIFYGELREELMEAHDPPPSMYLPALILGVIGLLVFLYPSILLQPLTQQVQAILP